MVNLVIVDLLLNEIDDYQIDSYQIRLAAPKEEP
jgi:hypothetical protein